jgi:uncharacterized delta-60 repeat protein
MRTFFPHFRASSVTAKLGGALALVLTLGACGGSSGAEKYQKAAGTLDSAFSVGEGFVGAVDRLVRQSDGKVIAGGRFTRYQSTATPYLARLESSGALDTTYESALGSGPNDSVYALAVSPDVTDGALYVGGAFTTWGGKSATRLARIKRDGSFDTSFPDVTPAGFNAPVSVLALDAASRLLTGGEFTSYGGLDFGKIARLAADTGRVDTTFHEATAPSATLKGFNLPVNAVIGFTDGSVLAGGSFTTYLGASANRLLRLRSDGVEDTSFSVNLGHGTANGGYNAGVLALLEDSTGALYVGGEFTKLRTRSLGYISKLSSTGVADAAFEAAIGTGFNGAVRALALDGEGNVLVGGDFTSFNGTATGRIARLNAAGEFDTTFASASGSGFDGSVRTLLVDPDGRVYAAGEFTSYNGTRSPGVARLK